MQITNVEPILVSSRYGEGGVLGQPLGVKTLGFVRVTTDSGFIGYGEAYSAIYVPELFEKIIQHMKPFLIGKDPTNPIKVYENFHIPFVSRSGLYKSAYSAVDIALWDIAAHYHGKSVAVLIDEGAKKEVSVYASGGSAAFDSSQIEEDLKILMGKGHTHYKMRVGFQDWETDLERVQTARQGLSGNGCLMVDAIMGSIHPAWNLDIAVVRAKDLEQFSLTWLEEPLPPDQIDDYRKLSRGTLIPIAAGEALASRGEFESYLLANCVSILQPDVTHCGGISAAIDICRMAEKFRIPLALHVWGSALAFKANAALALAFQGVEWLEFPSVNLELSNEILREPIVTINGTYLSSNEIGFGIEIDETLIIRFPYIPGSGFQMPLRAK